MAVLPIRTFPDPVLKKKSRKVSTLDGSVKKLIADLLETVHAAPGRAGLAAPQVGVSLRVAVISVPEGKDTVLVNPVLVRRSGERLIDEGCLSVPGYYGYVKRAESVTVKGLNARGKEVRIKADGLLAQALEHEIDHLNGILYLDHLEGMDKLHKVEPVETEIK
ncbi:MAG: peptide deformylase [Dehalococcoidales bacterium]|nr:peptide deformylase [Dehalococcoidales bacterium]